MYIPLGTIDVWEIYGQFDAARLFKAIQGICLSTDILVIGSYYDLPEDILQWLLANEIHLHYTRPFGDSFEANRGEHPNGRAYALHLGDSQIAGLTLLCRAEEERFEMLFDHMLIYRPGNPVLPLMDFHDAFLGGELGGEFYLSEHYAEKTVRAFALDLGATAKRIWNPAINSLIENYELSGQFPGNIWER